MDVIPLLLLMSTTVMALPTLHEVLQSGSMSASWLDYLHQLGYLNSSQSISEALQALGRARHDYEASITRPAVCDDLKIDAVTTMSDEATYMFKGIEYYKITYEGEIAPGYPRSIPAFFGGMPGFIDAAYTDASGRTYFFKGSRYWRFTKLRMDDGYPKQISQGFPGIPSDLDAALMWDKNKLIYFFKGSRYWRYDPSKNPPFNKANYPARIMDGWRGVPDNLDAGFKFHNGITYLFKGSDYWRWDDETDRVNTRYQYPASNEGGWLKNCNSI